jgi:hypothetical protein
VVGLSVHQQRFVEEDMQKTALGLDGHPSRTRRAMLMASMLAAGGAVPVGTAMAQANSRNVPPAEWARIQEAARKEGKVIVYGTMGPAQHERILEAFNAANLGVKMELVRIVGSALTAKVEQERVQPNVVGADLILTADIRWAGDAAKKGYLKTPVGPAAAAYPDAWLRGGQVALMAHTPWVMHYNTSLVKNPITSYQDLAAARTGRQGRRRVAGGRGCHAVLQVARRDEPRLPGEVRRAEGQDVPQHGGVGQFHRVRRDLRRRVLGDPGGQRAACAEGADEDGDPGAGLRLRLWLGGAQLGQEPECRAGRAGLHHVGQGPGGAWSATEKPPARLPNVPGALDVSKINLTLIDWDKVTPEGVKAFEARWNSLFGAR